MEKAGGAKPGSEGTRVSIDSCHEPGEISSASAALLMNPAALMRAIRVFGIQQLYDNLAPLPVAPCQPALAPRLAATSRLTNSSSAFRSIQRTTATRSLSGST